LPVTPVSPVPPVFPLVVVVVVGGSVVVVVVVGASVVVVVLVAVPVVVVTDPVVVVTGSVVGDPTSRIGVSGVGAALAVVPGVVALDAGCDERVSTCNRARAGRSSVGAVAEGVVVVVVEGAAAVVVVDTDGMYSWDARVTGSASVGTDAGCRERAANTNVAIRHATEPTMMLRALCGEPSGHGCVSR
jgi:hypothetical protein